MNEYDPNAVETDVDSADDMYDVNSKEYKRAAAGVLDLPATEDGEKLYNIVGQRKSARWEEVLLLREAPSFLTNKFQKAEEGDRCLTIVLPFVVDPTSEQIDENGEPHPSPNVGRYLTERLRFNYDAKKGSGQEQMHGMSIRKFDALIQALGLKDEFLELNCNIMKFFRQYGPELVGRKFQVVMNQGERDGEIRDEVYRFVSTVEDD